MASLRKHPNSPYWIACFTGADGRRQQRSTRVKRDGTVECRRKAQKLADTYEDVARGIATANQAQSVIHDLYKEATGESIPKLSLNAQVKEWLEGKQGSVAERTHGAYRRWLDDFVGFLEKRADGPLMAVTSKDVVRWRDSLAGKLAPKTVNMGIKTLRMFFGDARKEGLLTYNPAEPVKLLKKVRGSTRRPFTLEELGKLMPHLNDEWKSLVTFGLYTGQRLGDLVRLRWAHIDLDSCEIRFTTAKTGRHQKIPIAPHLLDHIQRRRSATPRVAANDLVHPEAHSFLNAKGSVSTLSRQFRDALGVAGLLPKEKHRRVTATSGTPEGTSDRSGRRRLPELSFHSLRHTTTTLLKQAGVSGAIAEEIVGHESAEMNRIYTHIGSDPLREAVGKLPVLAGREGADS